MDTRGSASAAEPPFNRRLWYYGNTFVRKAWILWFFLLILSLLGLLVCFFVFFDTLQANDFLVEFIVWIFFRNTCSIS